MKFEEKEKLTRQGTLHGATKERQGNILDFYDTPEEAHAVYCRHKEGYAKELSSKWAGKIDDRVIEYLENFKVKNQE